MNAPSDLTASNLRLLARCRPFSACSEALRESLAADAFRRSLSRGEHLWRAGDAATHFTVVVRGLVKIVRGEAGGGESILAIFGPRESLGDAAVFGKTRYPAGAVAASDEVEVLRVPAAALLDAASRDVAIAQAIGEALLAHTTALQAKIAIMTAGDVTRRLAMLLLHLAERFGDELDDGATLIPVALSRGELAELIGARVETIIRALSKWQKAGLVDAKGEGFRIPSLGALRELLGASAERGEDG